MADLDVPSARLIERAADDFAFGSTDLALHVGDFFWSFVDEQDKHVRVRVILEDRLGHLLHQYCLASARWGNDQTPLAEADGCYQIHHAITYLARFRFEDNPFFRMQRCQRIEGLATSHLIRVSMVDRLDTKQRKVAFVFFRRSNLSRYRHARRKSKAAYLRRRDIDVVGTGDVMVTGRT